MLGLIPAGGEGARGQPLTFSRELLPVGMRRTGDTEQPRAVSEYLVERLIAGGADRICFVIAPGKSDLLAYYGGSVEGVPVCYAVQPSPSGLCDAIFRGLPFSHPDESIAVGMPGTIWFPRDGLAALPDDVLSFLLFPVRQPELFEAVVTNDAGLVREVQVKSAQPRSTWIWGALKAPVAVFRELKRLWEVRNRADQNLGTLVNDYLGRGGRAIGVRAGAAFADVGTMHGYREALGLLQRDAAAPNRAAEPLIEAVR